MPLPMQLLYQTHSPYARKALVFAHEAGLAGQIEVIHHETSPTNRNEAVYAQNPLGKVPVLLRPGLAPLFDSDVICKYLDTLHNGKALIPALGEARWHVLRMQAIAKGMADSGIAVRWETTRRPEALRYPPLRDGHTQKLLASYDWLEQQLEQEQKQEREQERDADSPVHVGHIAVATALSWLEFRELPGFREQRPRLTAWYEAFIARPSMLATPLSGETSD